MVWTILLILLVAILILGFIAWNLFYRKHPDEADTLRLSLEEKLNKVMQEQLDKRNPPAA